MMDIAQIIVIDNIVVCRTVIALLTTRTIAAVAAAIIIIQVTPTVAIIIDFIIQMDTVAFCRTPSPL